MAMNKQRRSSNIANIFSYDDAGNIVIKDYGQVTRYSWNGLIHGFVGPVSVSSVSAATTDTDRFLVSDGGVLKYRTGVELLSDIGGVPSTRTLTINGVTQDLSADRSFTIPSANIYNSDGTLTGNRIVNTGGFDLTFTGTDTASAGLARFLQMTPTLVAAANNDTLVGLDINPTFTNGAFTNVANIGLRVSNSYFVVSGDYFPGSILPTKGLVFEASGGSARISSRFSSAAATLDINASTISLSAGTVTAPGTNLSSTVAQFNQFVRTQYTAVSGGMHASFGQNLMAANDHVLFASSGRKLFLAADNIVFTNQAASSATGQIFSSTGNWVIGSTTTDAGYKLDVQGTARVSGNLNTASANLTNASGISYLTWNAAGGGIVGTNTYIGTNVVLAYNLSSGVVGSVAIGGNFNAVSSSIFEIRSITKGLLGPRMTSAERDAIATPATGLQLYNTTGNTIDYYNGTSWSALASGNIYTTDGALTGNRTVTMGGSSLQFTGSDFVSRVFSTGRLSINRATSPLGIFHIQKSANSTEGHIFLSTPFPSTTPTSIVFQNNDFGSTGIGTGTFSWNTSGDGFIFSHRITVNTGDVSVSTGNVIVPVGYGYYFGGGEYIKHSGSGSWNIDFVTNSTQRMRLTNAGRLLIGTTTESTYRLDVSGTVRISNGGAGTRFENDKIYHQTTMDLGASSVNFGSHLYAGGNFRFDGSGEMNSYVKIGGNNTTPISLPSDAWGMYIGNKDIRATVGDNGSQHYFNIWYNDRLTNSVSKAFNIRIYGGQSAVDYGDVILQHDGTNARGNVGIGTVPNTAYRLDVSGAARLSGNLQFGPTGSWQTVINTRTSLANPLLTADYGVSNQMLLTFDNNGYLNMTGANFSAPIIYAPTRLSTGGNVQLNGNNKAVYWVNVTDQFIVGMSGQNYVIRANSGSLTSGGSLVSTSFLTGNTTFGGGVDAGFKVDIQGTARVQLPSVGASSYFVLSSASATAMNSYFGVTGSDFTFSKGEYSWGTNLRFNGTSFVRDNTGVGSWMISQSCGNDVANHFFRIRNINPNVGTINSSAFVIGGSGIVGMNREPVNGVGLSVSGTIGGNGLIIDQSVNRYVLGLSGASLRLTLNDAAQPVFQILNSSSTAIVFNSTNSYASAQVAIDSTTKGFLPPRLTTTQKNAIATPETGLQVYDSTTNVPNYYDGTAWVAMGGGGGTGTVTSIATSGPITGGTITTSGTIGITQSSGSTDGYLSSTDWTTFNGKVSASRTLTINGTTQDLSANRSWSVGTVTGSGATNVLPKWTSPNALGNSIIDDDGTSASVALLTGGYFNIKYNSVIKLALTGGTTFGSIDLPVGLDFKIRPDSAEGVTVFSDGNTFIGTAPSNAGYKFAVSGTSNFSNKMSVITSAITNDVALFKSTEPYITIEAAGASNSASIFLKPSTSAQNATIQNRTGGGIDLYTGTTPSLSLAIKSTGAVVASSTLGLNGVEDSVKSNTYTPTLTDVSNVSSSSVSSDAFRYIRIGSIVYVSGRITVSATSANTATEIEISLPIASNLTNSIDLSGVATTPANGYGQVIGDTTADTASFYVFPTSAGSSPWNVEFSYVIK